jgi:hypothetical protein
LRQLQAAQQEPHVPVAQPRNIELNLEALEQLEPAIRAHINMIIAQVENRLN